MKSFLFTLFALAATLPMSASTQWTLQSKEYNVDTVYHAKIGPGTYQTSLQLTGAQRLNIFYTTIDLTHPYVDIRVTKAGNKTAAVQRPSAQSAAYSKPGAQYFAGVNADFFSNSAPCGSTIVDGTIVNAFNNEFDNFFMTDDKVPHLGNLHFSGTVTSAGGATHSLNGINILRGENHIIIYTPYNGATSGTNAYGAEVSLKLVEGTLDFKSTATYEVVSAASTEGNTAIPADGVVLAGHGTGKTFVQSLSIGERITVTTSPAEDFGTITQMASGRPMILSGGVTLDTQGALDHLTSLNPRTAVGYNADRTKVVLLVVDGRGTSVGVVSKVLGDIMREVGCSDAMNFDGGGSSVLYTQEFGIRNRPSDGTERAVTNAVWAVATGPEDNTIAEIAFDCPVMTLPKYAYFVPTIYGYNKYGALVSTNVTGVTLSCDPALGVPTEDGGVLFANGSGTHALKATLAPGIECVIPVTIGTAEPRMRLQSVVVDSYRDYHTEVVATVNNKDMAIDNSALTWSSADPNIATVNEAGVISGVTSGQTVITGTVEDFTGTITANVQIPQAHYTSLVKDAAEWTLAGSGNSNRSVTSPAPDAIDLNYTATSGRSMYVNLKPTAEKYAYALPDSLRMVFNPGDATISKIVIKVGGKQVTYTPDIKQNVYNILLAPISDFVDTEDFASYPVRLQNIYFYLNDASQTQHTIAIKNLQGVHNAVDPSTGGVSDITAPGGGEGPAVAASVVSRGDDIILRAAAGTSWALFSQTGLLLDKGVTAVDNAAIPTSALTPGIYIISARSGLRTLSAKVLIR